MTETIGSILIYGLILFFFGWVFYMAYKQSTYQKKAIGFIHESHHLSRENLEVNKKMLKELETIAKHLAR